jgi:tRNA(Ile)-lysidine synthase
MAGGWSMHGAYGRVALLPPTTPADDEPAREIRDPGALPPGVDPGLLAGGPLSLRPRRQGDAIVLPGGRRSVADLLIDRKVPRHRREALRVLARGSDVVWIEGVALAVGAGASPGVTRSREEAWMARALELARAADEAGEAPVGAVVVVGERVVGEGENRTERDRDPSAHAEVLALRAAAAETGDWRLTQATLVVTLEPCPMCFGAVLQAHVGRIVYGARNEREGALGGVADLSIEGWKRRVEAQGGVLERECAELLSRAFARRRHARATDVEG